MEHQHLEHNGMEHEMAAAQAHAHEQHVGVVNAGVGVSMQQGLQEAEGMQIAGDLHLQQLVMPVQGSSVNMGVGLGSMGEVGDTLMKIAARKFSYPPFSAKCQQEIQRWIALYSQENSLNAMADADIRRDLVRILHEGCLAFCQELADDFVSLGLRSQSDHQVIQLFVENTQLQDPFVIERVLTDCEVHNQAGLRNLLRGPTVDRLERALKLHTGKSDPWVECNIKALQAALNASDSGLQSSSTGNMGMNSYTSFAHPASRMYFNHPVDSLYYNQRRASMPANFAQHDLLNRKRKVDGADGDVEDGEGENGEMPQDFAALAFRPDFMSADSKRRRRGWTAAEEEYVKHCIRHYRSMYPDKKSKRAPNALVEFIKQSPGSAVLQEGHDMDQNIKNKINDIYKKGMLEDTV